MSAPQDSAGGVGGGDDAERDLAAELRALDVDRNFSDSWTDFRSSMRSNASAKYRENLAVLSSQSRLASSGSSGGTFEIDILHEEEEEDDSDDAGDGDTQSGAAGAHGDDAPLSDLTPTEKRTLRLWRDRLARDVVFSRYYVPEQWESKEVRALQDFLRVEDPEHDANSPLNTAGETTKDAISAIFFPGVYDPKQVLLKRGPTLSNGADETELLLFTHAFVLSRIGFDALMEILFTVNSENPAKLQELFDTIDSDESGFIDRCELKAYFTLLGIPIGEIALSDIIEHFDTDHDGTIDHGEFEAALMMTRQPKKKTVLGSFGEKMMNALMAQDDPKLDFSAYQLSDIEKIESVDICCSVATEMYSQSSWAELVFAIFLKEQGDPLVMVCSKPEHRLAWMDAFRICCVKSTQMKADSGFESAKVTCKQFGWQHRIIRASIFSLVVCKDLRGLKRQLSKVMSSPDTPINDRDEYHGYSALHYAVVLDDMDCAELLIEHGANVNLPDDNEKNPLDHATLTGNKDMVRLLENHGATTKASKAKMLFKRAIEEQEQLKIKSATGGRKTIKAKWTELSDVMSALKERGEKIERLDNKTAQLQSGAADYAKMAKQLKEKKKKRSSFFGV